MNVDTTYSTKEQINICKTNDDGSLTITDVKRLNTFLATDENGLRAVAKLAGKFYPVQGNCFFGYIVVA